MARWELRRKGLGVGYPDNLHTIELLRTTERSSSGNESTYNVLCRWGNVGDKELKDRKYTQVESEVAAINMAMNTLRDMQDSGYRLSSVLSNGKLTEYKTEEEMRIAKDEERQGSEIVIENGEVKVK